MINIQLADSKPEVVLHPDFRSELTVLVSILKDF
jgi:hypothetical protein